MPRTHAEDRGLDRTDGSFEGRFGRMFELPKADFAGPVKLDNAGTKSRLALLQETQSVEEKNLEDLAGRMVKPRKRTPGNMPAGYRFLGQFIDHDLTFDPASSLQRDIDLPATVDYRTPRFDLDCLYGRGPADDPYLYRPKDGIRMRLGRKLTYRQKLVGYDVPRPEEPDPALTTKEDSEHALIGDPRNDENVIISQLHALFLWFHNRVADELSKRNGALTPNSRKSKKRCDGIISG